MPNPLKARRHAEQVAASKFQSMLHQLRALHDSELNYLREEVSRLRGGTDSEGTKPLDGHPAGDLPPVRHAAPAADTSSQEVNQRLAQELAQRLSEEIKQGFAEERRVTLQLFQEHRLEEGLSSDAPAKTTSARVTWHSAADMASKFTSSSSVPIWKQAAEAPIFRPGSPKQQAQQQQPVEEDRVLEGVVVGPSLLDPDLASPRTISAETHTATPSPSRRREDTSGFIKVFEYIKQGSRTSCGKWSSDLQHEASKMSIPSRNPDQMGGYQGSDIPDEPEEQDPDEGSRSPHMMNTLSEWGSKMAKLSQSYGNQNMEHLPFIVQQEEEGDSNFTFFDFMEIVVNSPFFEGFFAFLIVMNSLIMALEIQHTGFSVGGDIGYGKSGSITSADWTWAPGFFKGTEMFFGVVFTIELVLKMLGQNVTFPRDPWNWIDVVIVAIWIVGELAAMTIPIDASMLRIGRLVRLLRLLRLVRMIHSFDALYLMTTALKGCVSVLAWACALLVVVQMFIALLLNQYLYDTYFSDTSHSDEDLMEMFEYFGTFTRTMLSMFEITLGNWPPVCRLLSENVSELFMLLCVIHKLIIGFAVVGVINGVFMQETFKVASIDDRIMVRQKERSMAVHRQKMNALFSQADESNDGTLSKDEFIKIVGLPAVKTWLGSMELDTGDVDNLFSLIDDGDGQVSAKELVEGVARLKGSARSIDMVVLMRDFRKAMAAINQNLVSLQKTCDRNSQAIKAVSLSQSQNLPPA